MSNFRRWFMDVIDLARPGNIWQRAQRLLLTLPSGPPFTLEQIDHLKAEDWLAINQEIARLLDEKNDRSLALTAHSFLDDRLRWALQQAMISALSERELKELFAGSGPLSSFAARVRLCYALGMITKETKTEFLLLGTIRNKFAHDFKPMRFSDEPIASLVNQLEIDSEPKPGFDDPITKYARCCIVGMSAMFVAGVLARARFQGEKLEIPPKSTAASV